MPTQYVDPGVSRTKFDREIGEFLAEEPSYRRRGWLMLEVEFPRVRFMLCAANLVPPAVITGVDFDFSNYDTEPPSVRLTNPFSGVPYSWEDLPTTLKRRVMGPVIEIPGLQGPGGQQPRAIAEQTLMQPAETPFLCIPGVREYHTHPGHSGDPWMLHRAGGAGRLVRLLEVLDTYAVRPISGYNVQLIPQIAGFVQGEVPE